MQLLQNIRKLRKKYGLNQKELATHAGVSQSLIAKIESGKIDPSYTKAMQIIETLDSLRVKKEPKAKELMNKKIMFAKINESIKDIITTMKGKGISQMPVMYKNNVCGLITEGAILNKAIEFPEKFSTLKADEVMEDAPPIISEKTGLKIILEIIKDTQILLVADKGEVKGIISKSDLLGKI
jgi:predicted transcriptional regulator